MTIKKIIVTVSILFGLLIAAVPASAQIDWTESIIYEGNNIESGYVPAMHDGNIGTRYTLVRSAGESGTIKSHSITFNNPINANKIAVYINEIGGIAEGWQLRYTTLHGARQYLMRNGIEGFDSTGLYEFEVDLTITELQLSVVCDPRGGLRCTNNMYRVMIGEVAVFGDVHMPFGAPVLSATAGDSEVNLAWDEINGAIEYVVYRDGAEIARVTDTSYTDSDVTNGTAYTYTVTAIDEEDDESDPSNAETVTPQLAPISAPTVTATAGDGEVILSWDAVSRAVEYVIYRDGAEIARVTDTSYTDSDVTNGTAYTYTVTAIDDMDDESDPSNAVTVTPQFAPISAPALTATAGDGEVALSWDAVSRAVEYVVYRDGVEVTRVTDTNYTDSNVTNGTSYTYTVTAIDDTDIESDPSNPETVTPQLLPPAAPDVNATPDNNQVRLSWGAVSGADEYVVYRDGVEIARVTTTSYIDNDVVNDEVYSYTVGAVNAQGETLSNPVTARPIPVSFGDNDFLTTSGVVKTAIDFLQQYIAFVILALAIIFARPLSGMLFWVLHKIADPIIERQLDRKFAKEEQILKAERADLARRDREQQQLRERMARDARDKPPIERHSIDRHVFGRSERVSARDTTPRVQRDRSNGRAGRPGRQGRS